MQRQGYALLVMKSLIKLLGENEHSKSCDNSYKGNTKSMKKFLILTIAALLTGCSYTDIPEHSITLDSDLSAKLSSVKSVRIVVNPIMFESDCYADAYLLEKRYYLLSGPNELSDDYAMWKCAPEMESLECPNLTVSSANGQALIRVEKGFKSDFSKDHVVRCATEAVRHAVTELRPTSKEVVNRDSW